MISEESCDTEAWRNDAVNWVLHSQTYIYYYIYILKLITVILNCNNILKYYCFHHWSNKHSLGEHKRLLSKTLEKYRPKLLNASVSIFHLFFSSSSLSLSLCNSHVSLSLFLAQTAKVNHLPELDEEIDILSSIISRHRESEMKHLGKTCGSCYSGGISGIVHPKIMLPFTHPHVITNLYDLLSSVKHKRTFLPFSPQKSIVRLQKTIFICMSGCMFFIFLYFGAWQLQSLLYGKKGT